MIVPIIAQGTAYALTNLAAAEAPLLGSLIVFADLTNFTQYQISRKQLVAGSGISFTYPRFSGTAVGASWTLNAATGAVNIGSFAVANNTAIGPKVTLDVGKRVPLAIQMYASGGNGVIDPSINSLIIQFFP